MSLEEFEPAEAQEGYLYELGRGVIVVTDVPKRRHTAQLFAITCQFHGYHAAHPGRIVLIATGSECKILLEDLQSERHPDLAIYKNPPPEDEEDFWNQWIPEIVVEVVSPRSRHRDYVEKREEYLAFGVREYWIFDADKAEMLVLRRSRGQWAERVVRPPDLYRSRLLPGFELACGPVFEAARAAEG
jgi:Uma2 family endonuclease